MSDNKFKVGDTVININKTSRFTGEIGTVVFSDDWAAIVEYENNSITGIHPHNRPILRLIEKNHFNSDLFSI